MMPNPNSRYKQGFYQNAKKYKGKMPIIYRSGLEKQFMDYCEHSPEIVEWSSEPFPISYASPTGAPHTYWVDFVCKNMRGDVVLVEVKPDSQIPRTHDDIRFSEAMSKNHCKWEAARAFCKKNANMHFIVVSETFFKRVR